MSYRNDPPDIEMRHGAYLPHWTRKQALYVVTFRLADSLPQCVLDAWVQEREEIVELARQQGRPLSVSEENRLKTLHSEKVETYLDAGHGACHLHDSRIAEIVGAEFRHFEGERYLLHAWCIMPNHVHVVVEPSAGQALPRILHSWKSYTAKAANRILGISGTFWRAEYYDHLIRDFSELEHAVQYVAENPVKAGLRDWPWVYVARAARPWGLESMGGSPMLRGV